MLEISNEMGILFYGNICNEIYSKENDLPMYEFLVKEYEKQSKIKNEQLNCVASLIKLIKNFQKIIYN